MSNFDRRPLNEHSGIFSAFLEKSFKAKVTTDARPTAKGRPQYLTLCTSCSGELKIYYMNQVALKFIKTLIYYINTFVNFKAVRFMIKFASGHSLWISQSKTNREPRYCSYARSAQPGPNRTRLCRRCIAAKLVIGCSLVLFGN